MKISLNTIKQYTDINVSVDELIEKINTQLGAIEEVIDLGARYKDTVIVKIVEAVQHPDADRLRVTKIDDGGVVQDVERDENGLVQVVCGAPNAREGIFAVWLPPRSTVPASFDDTEPFVLGSRELRGVMSHGMLAAIDELGLGSDHAGILEINPNERRLNNVEIAPGVRFADAYGLNDTIIDVENKMFTHRPDLFGQLGVAREIAGIQHIPFRSPEWYSGNAPVFNQAATLELEVFNDATDVVPRFMTVALQNIEVRPSPLWLQIELARLGAKSINNVVDATNYLMLLTAQPTHAYDYDKLRGHKLGARMAHDGESVTLLNGKQYTLSDNDIVIADGEGPVGLAGIMGGGESEVSSDTKNIVLEVANFDMYTLRKSSMRHGVFTDALTRFNKGQSPLQNPYVLKLLIDAIFETAGGEQASDVFDLSGEIATAQPISISSSFISERLGANFDDVSIEQYLENVEISVDEAHMVQPPFWRTDLELPEDIVEEVGRLHGYEKLPRTLPLRSTKPTLQNESREKARIVRQALARAGANEVLTYSFVHEKILAAAGQDKAHAYQLSNALSPDLQYYRLSLTPSLLDKLHANQRAGYGQFALFEINKVHFKGVMDPQEPSVPEERKHVGFTISYADKEKPAGSAFYHAKEYLSQIMDLDATEFVALQDIDIANSNRVQELVAPFEPARSAVLVRSGEVLGVAGEYRTSVKRSFKLPDFAAGFEIDESLIVIEPKPYRSLSKYPKVSRDICFNVASDVAYGQVMNALRGQSIPGVGIEVALLDIYQGDDAMTKNITFSISLEPQNKTLASDEATQIIQHLSNAVIDATGARVV